MVRPAGGRAVSRLSRRYSGPTAGDPIGRLEGPGHGPDIHSRRRENYARARENGVKRLLALAAVLPLLPSRGTAATDTVCHIQQLLQLPVTMSGMRPLVPAKINGETVMFVVDSGAFWSFLTPAAAAEHHLRLGPAPVSLQVEGIGGTIDVRLTTVKELTLERLPIKSIDFLVGGNEVGEGAVGLLGQNVFHMGDVEYDLANGVIRLMRTRNCRGVPLSYWQKSGARSEMDISFATPIEPHTTGTAYLNGNRLKVLFDTGASSSVVSRRAAERAGVDLTAEGVQDGGVHQGVGRSTYRTWIAPVASFKIGDEEIQHTRLRIADKSLLGSDMLVGTDFFLSHRIYVDSEHHRLYFTYNGGPVFNLAAGPAYDRAPVATGADAEAAAGAAAAGAPDAGPAEPSDAAGYARRGAAFAARREYERAIADLTRAVTMAPEDASFQYELGEVLYRNRQPIPALAALDRSLQLRPDDPKVLGLRALVRLYGGDREGADADAEASAKQLSLAADLRRELAQVFTEIGRYDRAVSELDAWIGSHPNDAGMAAALNSRCWARALANRDLPLALKDCDDAVRRSAKWAAIFDSRGLVRLRLGDYAGAVADYDSALALSPRIAWSLYGRGIAKQKLGRTDEGKADLAAAVAVDPSIVKTAAKVGVAP